MIKLNRRTRVLILTIVMAVVLVGIYVLGICIPDSAVATSFLNAKKPPSKLTEE